MLVLGKATVRVPSAQSGLCYVCPESRSPEGAWRAKTWGGRLTRAGDGHSSLAYMPDPTQGTNGGGVDRSVRAGESKQIGWIPVQTTEAGDHTKRGRD